MLWETLGSAILGVVLAYAAVHWLSDRFPNRQLVLATGPCAALLGGLVTHAVMGAGHTVAVLVVAVCVGVALLSLLHGGGVRSSRLTQSVPATQPRSSH